MPTASLTSRFSRTASGGGRSSARRSAGSSTRSSTCSGSMGVAHGAAPRGAQGAAAGRAARGPPGALLRHIDTDGIAFYEAARARGLEGIMAKVRSSPYLPGMRSSAWQKVKIRPEQELVVGGWNPGKGAAADLGALHVGIYVGDALRYAGKIGAGFTRRPGRSCSRPSHRSRPSPAVHPPPPRASPRRHHVGRPFAGHPGGVRRLDGRRARRQASYKGLDRGKTPARSCGRCLRPDVPWAPASAKAAVLLGMSTAASGLHCAFRHRWALRRVGDPARLRN